MRAARYILKVRRRERHDVAIRGGGKVGFHRRRVMRWTEWKTVGHADGPIGVLELYDAPRYRTYDKGIFYAGKQLRIESVRAQVAQERARRGE